MHESMTAGASRAIKGAAGRAERRGSVLVEPIDLLAALIAESESRAAVLLLELGLDRRATAARHRPPGRFARGNRCRKPARKRRRASALRRDAVYPPRGGRRSPALDRGRAIGTEHLLKALIELGFARRALANAGVDLDRLRDALEEKLEIDDRPIPLPSELPPLGLVDPVEIVDLARVLDASPNRPQEGLRVIDDYVRFILNDPFLGKRLKDVRVRLSRRSRGSIRSCSSVRAIPPATSEHALCHAPPIPGPVPASS